MSNSSKALGNAWDLVAVIVALGIPGLAYTKAESLQGFDWKAFFKALFFEQDLSAVPAIIWGPFVAGFVVWIIMTMFNPFEGSTSYGSARWATLKMAKKMGLVAATGLIIGVMKGRYLRFDGDLSAFLLAPPGTGKTAAVVIPILLSCDRSIIVHDVKDELFQITGKRRAEMGKVIRFAPASEDTHRLNPLDKQFIHPDRNQLAENLSLVDRLATMLICEDGDNKKVDHWIRDGRNLFKTYTLYLLWKHGETSFPKIRAFALSDPEPKEFLFDLLEDEGDGMPEILKQSLNRMVAKEDKEFSSVFSTMTGFLEIFAEPKIENAFSACDFNIYDLREETTTIYLHVPPQDIERLYKLISLFLELVGSHLLSHERKPEQSRVLFLLDEFIWLGRVPAMLKLPSLSRGQGVAVMFVAQSYAQVEELYGKTGVGTLKDTCAYRIILPQNNEQTAKEIAEAIGDETRKRQSESRTRGDTRRSETTSEEGHKLIRSQQLLSMKAEECIILAQNHFQTPIRAKQCRWYKDKNMKDLAGSVDLEITPKTIEEKAA